MRAKLLEASAGSPKGLCAERPCCLWQQKGTDTASFSTTDSTGVRAQGLPAGYEEATSSTPLG